MVAVREGCFPWTRALRSSNPPRSRAWRFTRKKLAEIQETVQLLAHLSRHELALTLSVQHGWQTAKGGNLALHQN